METHKLVNLEYTNIEVMLPSIDFFLEKIKNDEIFHFYKVNHGMIDSIYSAYKGKYNELEIDLLEKNYEKISKNIQIAFKDAEWGLSYWHSDSNVEDYLINFIRVLVEVSNIHPKIKTGISLGVGLHTFWGVWEQHNEMQVGRTDVIKKIMNVNKSKFYYAGLFKHYTIKGEIFKLFNLLNELNFEVVFLGPDYLRLYKDVFNINKFHHINIPVRGAANNFGDYIKQLKGIENNTNNKTIVLHSAGQMLSAVLVDELKDTNIWGLDIGRSLDILIKDKVESEPTMYKCWTILDENGLNNYVDELRSSAKIEKMKNYKFTQDWFRVNQFENWLSGFEPNKILEIGSFEGKSTVWFIETYITNDTKSITCIDPWLNYNHSETSLHTYSDISDDRKYDNNIIKDRFLSNIELTGRSSQVNVLHGLSHIELPKLSVNGDRFDLILIDGNHTASFVLTDAIYSWWLLNEGGIMIFDDYGWVHEKNNNQSVPKFAIDSFIECFRGYLDVIHIGEYAIIKKKKF